MSMSHQHTNNTSVEEELLQNLMMDPDSIHSPGLVRMYSERLNLHRRELFKLLDSWIQLGYYLPGESFNHGVITPKGAEVLILSKLRQEVEV